MTSEAIESIWVNSFDLVWLHRPAGNMLRRAREKKINMHAQETGKTIANISADHPTSNKCDLKQHQTLCKYLLLCLPGY